MQTGRFWQEMAGLDSFESAQFVCFCGTNIVRDVLGRRVSVMEPTVSAYCNNFTSPSRWAASSDNAASPQAERAISGAAAAIEGSRESENGISSARLRGWKNAEVPDMALKRRSG